MDIFGDIERFASDLYPHRWSISIGLVVVAAAFVAVAIRQRWHRVVVRQPLRIAAIAVPLAAVLVVAGWYTLSPLWERTYLEEASPLEAAAAATVTVAQPAAGSPAASPADSPTAETQQPPARGAPTASPETESTAPTIETGPPLPRQTHVGTFMGADDFHFGRGTARLIETAPGAYTLRFEDFSVRNGPDLFVYLTPDPMGGSIDGAINLGKLKATDGAFNYELPPGTDIAQFRAAIVWCRQFAVLFAAAELAAV